METMSVRPSVRDLVPMTKTIEICYAALIRGYGRFGTTYPSHRIKGSSSTILHEVLEA